MRLDIYLKITRLTNRSNISSVVLSNGRIFINGHIAPPSQEIKEGDIIKFEGASRPTIIKVLKVPTGFNIDIHEVPKLYEIIE